MSKLSVPTPPNSAANIPPSTIQNGGMHGLPQQPNPSGQPSGIQQNLQQQQGQQQNGNGGPLLNAFQVAPNSVGFEGTTWHKQEALLNPIGTSLSPSSNNSGSTGSKLSPPSNKMSMQQQTIPTTINSGGILDSMIPTSNAQLFQTTWQPVPPQQQQQNQMFEYMVNPMTPIPSAANIPPPNDHKPPQKPH